MAKKKDINQEIKSLKEQIKALTKLVPKKAFGRPTLFDEKQLKLLERLCSFPGIKEEQVAWILEVHRDTIEKVIKRNWGMTFTAFREQKKSLMQFQLINKQYEVAMGGNIPMLIFLGKNYLGQADKQETKLSNDQSAPFQLIINEPKD